MQLSRLTPCASIQIRFPRWKQRVVGVASYRVMQHNAIDILKEDKEGKRYYPETLYGSGEMIKKCPTQVIKGGTVLHLVPISNLEVLERV